MKSLIVLVVGLLAVGCLTPEQKQKTLRDSVVGEYERKVNTSDGFKRVFLENGIVEDYLNDKRASKERWKLVDGKIHRWHRPRLIFIYRINADKSITWIAEIEGGKRKDRPKEDQTTFKKIK